MNPPLQLTFRRTLLLSLGLVVAVALTGCDDDNVVFANDGPPAVPTGVYTITGDRSVEVRWNPVREDDMAGYGVYVSATLDGAYERVATLNGVESN